MEWKQIILQIVISLITTTFATYIGYLKAKKELETKVQEVKINSETEIQKIQQESNKEIEKIRAEHEEYRKTKRNDSKLNSKEQAENMQNELTMKFLQDILENPDKADKQIKVLEKMNKRFPNNKRSKKR